MLPTGPRRSSSSPKSGYWERGGQLRRPGARRDQRHQGRAERTDRDRVADLGAGRRAAPRWSPATPTGTTASSAPRPSRPRRRIRRSSTRQQVRLAKQLEQLRLGYKPTIDQALAQIPGLSRSDIALFWTFTITTQAEVTFDPAKLVIPFPNDILNPTGSQVAIPAGSGLPPDLVAGLNTLDGFSTTAPIVTENGDGHRAAHPGSRRLGDRRSGPHRDHQHRAGRGPGPEPCPPRPAAPSRRTPASTARASW